MSWLRTAVNRAVEVGGSNPLSRTVRYAGQAVVGSGAKLFQDRGVNYNSLSISSACFMFACLS